MEKKKRFPTTISCETHYVAAKVNEVVDAGDALDGRRAAVRGLSRPRRPRRVQIVLGRPRRVRGAFAFLFRFVVLLLA